ncbi:MAG: pyruvate ferredoxin oxidoreductase [Aquificota bacterium]|nr:MAG: pyruvate ferredoxin oxidoreductase [Aquificota bacterium]
MGRIEVRIGGFGGQGVILMGVIMGKAYSIFEGKEATLTQSFGPEARGGACSAQVVLEDTKVLYPYTTNVDCLIVMSQEAYTTYYPRLKDDGILLIEEELVKPGELKPNQKVYGIPSTRIAEEVGRAMVQNIVMLGFFTAVSGIVGREAMRRAVESSVPSHTIDMNLRAFDRGYEYGVEKYGQK